MEAFRLLRGLNDHLLTERSHVLPGSTQLVSQLLCEPCFLTPKVPFPPMLFIWGLGQGPRTAREGREHAGLGSSRPCPARNEQATLLSLSKSSLRPLLSPPLHHIVLLCPVPRKRGQPRSRDEERRRRMTEALSPGPSPVSVCTRV